MIPWLVGGGLLGLTAGALLVLGLIRVRGVWPKLRRLLVGLILVGLGALASGLGLALRAFEMFSASTVVGEVRCRWLGPKEFELTWMAFHDHVPEPPQTFDLRGDQWSISGGIVKWHPWLTVLGLPSYQKLERLSGRYGRLADELRQPPTAVELDGGLDFLWWWLYRWDPMLPFLEAVYGSAAFVPVETGVVYEVAVSPSGYLIRRDQS